MSTRLFKLLGLQRPRPASAAWRPRGAFVGKDPRSCTARVKIGPMPLTQPWRTKSLMLREAAGERQKWQRRRRWQHLGILDSAMNVQFRCATARPGRIIENFDVDAYRIFTRFMRDSSSPQPCPSVRFCPRFKSGFPPLSASVPRLSPGYLSRPSG